MRSGGRGSVLLLLLAAVVLLRPWESWDELGQNEESRSATVLVTRVVDGDTVEVDLDGETEDVRYIGVDTPETVKPGEPVECFGAQASSFNHRLVEGRRVRLVFGAERRDQYGRLLAYVYLGDRFVNAELVRRGLAETLTIPPNDRFAERLERLEIAAARAGRGLWGAC
ncbi:MAG TPA: thermonuclease family protein [Solirubrobacterales bacterium]|nr:thermonuclease family protein [Solirubrobacterales bacterium]